MGHIINDAWCGLGGFHRGGHVFPRVGPDGEPTGKAWDEGTGGLIDWPPAHYLGLPRPYPGQIAEARMGIAGRGELWYERPDGTRVKAAASLPVEPGQVYKMTAHMPVPHGVLVDLPGHVCGPGCPSPFTSGPASRTADFRYRLRRYWHPWWWTLRHLHEYRIVHRSRIPGDED